MSYHRGKPIRKDFNSQLNLRLVCLHWRFPINFLSNESDTIKNRLCSWKVLDVRSSVLSAWTNAKKKSKYFIIFDPLASSHLLAIFSHVAFFMIKKTCENRRQNRKKKSWVELIFSQFQIYHEFIFRSSRRASHRRFPLLVFPFTLFMLLAT